MNKQRRDTELESLRCFHNESPKTPHTKAYTMKMGDLFFLKSIDEEICKSSKLLFLRHIDV